MGAGKTSVFSSLSEGQKFAHYSFVDSDLTILESHSHESISAIVEEHGWKKFREIEKKVIEEAVKSNEMIVLSLGGGSLGSETLDLLAGSEVTLVWLKVDFRELLNRALLSRANRPLLKERSEKELFNLYQEREKFYSEADIIIENKSLDNTVTFLEKFLIGK